MKYLDVATLNFSTEKCIGCLKCIEVCPHGVFVKHEVVTMSHKDLCIECGACQMNCPTNAISVNAGTGCASAVIQNQLKKHKFLSKFVRSSC